MQIGDLDIEHSLRKIHARLPVVIPEATSVRVAQALRDLRASPSGAFSSQRPGWTSVGENEPMRELRECGDEAVSAILANLGNFWIRMELIQVLGKLKAKQSVGPLLDLLWMEDCFHDMLIVAVLAEITEHKDGYSFHRRWFDPVVRKAAVAAYKDWAGRSPAAQAELPAERSR